MDIGIFVDGGDYETLGNWTSNDNNSIKISGQGEEEEELMMVSDLRRGPWTVEEDMLLVNYISEHGEGRWNSLAYSAGLKRTGKSCRLRWLNYLRPNVRRGNITPEEQLLILQLHSRWGNRWSKIAQHLPGRTDNEIKNYWRTRVQKHAKQMKCDVNSQQFKDVMQHIWIPRLLETIRAKSGTKTAAVTAVVTSDSTRYETNEGEVSAADELKPCPESSVEECSTGTISQLSSPPPVSSDLTTGDCFAGAWANWADEIPAGGCGSVLDELSQGLVDFDDGFSGCGEISEEFWNSMDDFWSL